MIIKLSKGEAHLKAFVDAKTASQYQTIVRKGVVQPAVTLTPAEEEELKKLPLAERIAIRKSITPEIPLESIGEGLKYLAVALTEKLIVDDQEKAVNNDTLGALPKQDYEMIEEAAAKMISALESSGEDKKKQ